MQLQTDSLWLKKLNILFMDVYNEFLSFELQIFSIKYIIVTFQTFSGALLVVNFLFDNLEVGNL